MNRYLLFFMLVGLQANIVLSNPIKDFFNSAFRYFKPTTAYAYGYVHPQLRPADAQPRESQTHPTAEPQQCSIAQENGTPLSAALEKQKLMDRLKRCHKYPEETMAVINEVEKQIHHYVGDNLNEEQRKNMVRFNNVCNEHIIKSTEELSYIDNENIKKMPHVELGKCTSAFQDAQGASFATLAAGGLAYLLKGPIENNIFEKMAQECKRERKASNYLLRWNRSIQSFKNNFYSIAHIENLPEREKDNAYALGKACSKYELYVRRGNQYTTDRDKAYNEAIKCVAKYAEIREEGREAQQIQEVSQKVYNAFDPKNPGDISYLFRGPSINAESIKKTIRACKQDLINKQNKNREE